MYPVANRSYSSSGVLVLSDHNIPGHQRGHIIIRKSDPPRGPCDEVVDLEVTGFFAEAVEAAAVALLTRVGVTKQS